MSNWRIAVENVAIPIASGIIAVVALGSLVLSFIALMAYAPVITIPGFLLGIVFILVLLEKRSLDKMDRDMEERLKRLNEVRTSNGT